MKHNSLGIVIRDNVLDTILEELYQMKTVIALAIP